MKNLMNLIRWMMNIHTRKIWFSWNVVVSNVIYSINIFLLYLDTKTFLLKKNCLVRSLNSLISSSCSLVLMLQHSRKNIRLQLGVVLVVMIMKSKFGLNSFVSYWTKISILIVWIIIFQRVLLLTKITKKLFRFIKNSRKKNL